MELKVTLCKSTGLTPGNSCNSIDIIRNSLPFSSMIQVTGVAVKQTKGLSVIRLPLTFEQGIEVDYAIVGDVGYWVVDIQYPNDNVGLVVLSCDFFTTVGVNNIEIVGGWCTRRHVLVDTPFMNTLPEPFSPEEEFQLDMGGEVKREGSSELDSLSVVIATVDLGVSDGGEPFAQAWQVDKSLDLDTRIGLFTPRINNLNIFTQYYMDVWSPDGVLGSKHTVVPYTSIFRVDKQEIQTNIARMYSIGLDNVILDSYEIPGNYIDLLEYADGTPPWIPIDLWTRIPETTIIAIGCDDKIITSNLSPTFGEYKNAKVYSGQFQKIHLTSPSFGDDIEYTPEDIVSLADPSFIYWRCTADLRFNGRPICYPSFYKGAANTKYLEPVRGAEWMKSPVKQIGQSGFMTARIARNQKQAAELVNKASSSVVNHAGQAINNKALALNELKGLGKDMAGIAIEGAITATENFVSDNFGVGYIQANQPTINFLQVPSMQNYIGNNFVDYRVRLSDGDMMRFDRFLTQFGYTVSEPLNRNCFFGRKNFNYVKADSPVIRLKGKTNLAFLNGVKSALQSGVRIWHKVPEVGDMDDNPILETKKEVD